MSNKKPKSKNAKEAKKHDFSHLTKTVAAAKAVESEKTAVGATASPLDKNIKQDLKTVFIVIGAFVAAIIILWIIFGKSNLVLNLVEQIKFL